MKHVFIAHPLGADTHEGVQANLKRAIRWYQWCCDSYPDYSFEATWMLNCMVYDDGDTGARDQGIQRSMAALTRCDELWAVGGAVSEGVAAEIELMTILRRPVYDLTGLGAEPPPGPLRQEAIQ